MNKTLKLSVKDRRESDEENRSERRSERTEIKEGKDKTFITKQK